MADRPLHPVEKAIIALSDRCDGAIKRDFVGWNGTDSGFGKAMAQRLLEGKSLTPKMRQVIKKILPKYHGQFEPNSWRHVMHLLPEWARSQDSPPPTKPEKPLRLAIDGKVFRLYTRFEHKDLAKAIPGAFWNGEEKAWEYYQTNDGAVRGLAGIYDKIEEVDPAAKEALVTRIKDIVEIDERIRKVALIKDGVEEVDVSVPLKTELFVHQKKAFAIGVSIPHVALLMEQRTGKTLSAMAILGYRIQHDGIHRGFVVTPSIQVAAEWKSQFKQHVGYPLAVGVLHGSGDDKRAQIAKAIEFSKSNKLPCVLVGTYTDARLLTDELVEWAPEIVIADESHKLKNPAAQQTRAVTLLGEAARFRMILSGTPVTQSPMDIYGQYKFLEPRIFGRSKQRFYGRYAIMGGYGGYKVVGYRNLEELAEKAHSIAYRVTFEEAIGFPGGQVPEYQNIPVELEPAAWKIYEEMERDAIVKLEDKSATAMLAITQMLRLSQIVGGFMPFKDDEDTPELLQVSRAKLDALTDVLEGIVDSGQRAVVFARFRAEIAAIEKMLDEQGWAHRGMMGGMSYEARVEAMESFKHDPEVKVFVAQIATGGLGIDLSAARYAIFYSWDFSLTNYEQAKFRVLGPAQDRRVIYLHLTARGTIDTEIIRALQEKKSIANMVVDELKDIFTRKEEYQMAKKAREKGGTPVTKGKVVGEARQVVDKDFSALLSDLEEELEKDQIPIDPTYKKPKRLKNTEIDKAPMSAKQGREEETPKKKKKKGLKSGKTKRLEGEVITIKQLAIEFGHEDGKRLRKWLRANADKETGRWEWTPDDPMVAKLRAKFGKK